MSETLDTRDYSRFCTRQNLHKALNTLQGIIAGIEIDRRVTLEEVDRLQDWCVQHHSYRDKNPFNEIIPLIQAILDDGKIDPDELEDLKWFVGRAGFDHGFYDGLTSKIQELQGIASGILIDGQVDDQEIVGLRDWLHAHSELKGCYPFDELLSAVEKVLEDGKISELERAYLKDYFASFEGGSLGSTVSAPAMASFFEKSPKIVFELRSFCFTGTSERFARKQLFQLIEELDGYPENKVDEDTDYLIYGAKGNQCWAYSLYGRKVEKALQLQKEGNSIKIIHERDFLACPEVANYKPSKQK